jgi:hypothetical protein
LRSKTGVKFLNAITTTALATEEKFFRWRELAEGVEWGSRTPPASQEWAQTLGVNERIGLKGVLSQPLNITNGVNFCKSNQVQKIESTQNDEKTKQK